MTEIWFIRHGESATNIGLRTDSDQTTPLTDTGQKQANHVAEAVNRQPDRIIVSPYDRTLITAKPTINKFPKVLVETWPVHEYSYLGHDQYRNTTTSERRALSENYFRTANPEIVIGPGGESFNQFIDRVRVCLERLANLDDDFIILFGHGWFMRACLWYQFTQQETGDDQREYLKQVRAHLPHTRLALTIFTWMNSRRWVKTMHKFLVFSAAVQTPNCSIMKFSESHGGTLVLSGFDISHLPADLRKTSLRNR